VASGALPARLQMGLDEALLTLAGPPTLRLYRWQPATVSIGYFQRAAAFAQTPFEVVRRLTGGGAICHDREITFALTVDCNRLPNAIEASYRLVHDAIRAALASAGVNADDPPVGTPAAAVRPADSWCFAEPTCLDLITPRGGKIVGSAQRRVRQPRPRVLHHGSIVISPPAYPAACGAVDEFTDASGVEQQIEHALCQGIAAALDMGARAGELTPAELTRGHQLAEERYGNDRHTHRR